MQPVGINIWDDRQDEEYCNHPLCFCDSRQSGDNHEDPADHPEVSGQTMGAVPVFLIGQRPGDFDADGIILPCFRQIISDNDEDYT